MKQIKTLDNQPTFEDDFGVIFNKSKKRILGVNKEKFTCESYQVPDTVEKIADDAFCGTSSLKHIQLDNKLRVIGDNVFIHSGLEELVIPESVEEVGACLCEGCKSLKKVEFKNDLACMEIACFNGCSALEEVILPKDILAIQDNVFAHTTALKHLELPDGLQFIGGECFMDSGIEALTIPRSVDVIGEDAFADCENLSLSIKAAPHYRNFPQSQLEPMPAWMFIEEFKKRWIRQLLGNFARVVEARTPRREHQKDLEHYKYELKRCLKWIQAIEIEVDFPYYTLTTALTTKDTENYNLLFFFALIDIEVMIEYEAWHISDDDKLAIAIAFKSQLQKMYDLIENGMPADIDYYVESIRGIKKPDKASKESFVEHCLLFTSYGLPRIPLTNAWLNGPFAIITNPGLIAIMNHFRDNK